MSALLQPACYLKHSYMPLIGAGKGHISPKIPVFPPLPRVGGGWGEGGSTTAPPRLDHALAPTLFLRGEREAGAPARTP